MYNTIINKLEKFALDSDDIFMAKSEAIQELIKIIPTLPEYIISSVNSLTDSYIKRDRMPEFLEYVKMLKKSASEIKSKVNKKRPKIVIFEGIDGSGKDTQIAMLAKYLREKNINHSLIDSISEGPVGKEIRRLLSKDEMNKIEYLRLLHLFIAEQYLVLESVNDVVKKGQSDYILINRSPISTYAYAMGYESNKDDESIMEVLDATIDTYFRKLINFGNIHIVYMDIDPMQAMYRIAKRTEFDGLDTEYTESFEYLKEVKSCYLNIIKYLNNYLTNLNPDLDKFYGFKVKAELPRESIHTFIKNELKLNDIPSSKRRSNAKSRKR